ncbi:Predicted CoA-binding protein [Terribacillus halophilus]|uniref:Predicted CoA-binding protein n=1 Tax=Terribacillus halophilus TaxID=361279 RepID=A0A1G6MTV2_9BACI|nr:CoA-binding protein [Terribacillus halophilus]SDC58959.1 Predicted CoA-binding protein [Terribacillus halophilus]
MAFQNPENEQIRDILLKAKTIAVVGLSDSPDRTSYGVSRAMQQAGYRIIPVNPNVTEVLGEKAYPSLAEVPDEIDIINVFRRSEFLPGLAREAGRTNARVFWTQQGVYDEGAAAHLEQEGCTVLMDLCIKVAHSVLVGPSGK